MVGLRYRQKIAIEFCSDHLETAIERERTFYKSSNESKARRYFYPPPFLSIRFLGVAHAAASINQRMIQNFFIYLSQVIMAVQLPQELLQQTFSYLSRNQKALHACSLTSASWYSASIAFLYESPEITGKNYDAFVQAICPSVNAHVRRNGLADMVRVLDMSSLVHNGSKSLTARLLGRVKTGLEEFVAPQASFA